MRGNALKPLKHAAVIVVGAGLLQHYIIKEARNMGFAVVATDGNPQAPGFADADMQCVVDTYDSYGTAALVPMIQQKYDIRGVVTCGADVAPTVALVAERACVPGIPYRIAQRSHDKASVRACLSARGLNRYQPQFLIEYRDDALAIVQTEIAYVLHGYPVVVKPLSQRASRGVSIIQHQDQVQAAVTKALEYGDEYLIEERLLGSEHSAEMILGAEGVAHWFNVVDRQFRYDDGIPIETGHINPTALTRKDQEAIYTMMVEASRVLDIRWGAFKCDVIMTTAGPKILECTARLSGGFDSQVTSPLTGRHPMRQLLQLSCGLPVDPQPEAVGYSACAAILPPHQGILQQIPDPVMTERTMVSDILWTVAPGDQIQAPQHLAQRSGYVLAQASEYEDAWDIASQVAEGLANNAVIA